MKKFVALGVSGLLCLSLGFTAKAKVLDVFTNDAPVLREQCLKVEKFDDELHEKLDNIRDTLIQSKVAGFAANQLGYTIRAFVLYEGIEGQFQYDDPAFQNVQRDKQPIEFINPEIISAQGEQTTLEGCVSTPGLAAFVHRPMDVIVKAFDRNGNSFMFSTTKFGAQAVCHEYDHLDGILCTDAIRAIKIISIKKLQILNAVVIVGLLAAAVGTFFIGKAIIGCILALL